jgi:hypothetical protein
MTFAIAALFLAYCVIAGLPFPARALAVTSVQPAASSETG